jgi:hypothetical protein
LEATPFQDSHGRTTYYFFETQDLPLFGPLRTLGVPESWIDVVEPFFRVIVELGYDRTIPPWEPTPARLIPLHDPVTVARDLANATGEGINNALALIGLSPPASIPAPPTTAMAELVDEPSATETAKAEVTQQVTSTDAPAETERVTSMTNVSESQQVSTDTTPHSEQVTSTEPTGIPQISADTATPGKDRTETAVADEASMGPAMVSAPRASTAVNRFEPSASRSIAESAKPTRRGATPRPVVRPSLGVDEPLRDLTRRVTGGRPATRLAAASDGAPARPSPAGSSLDMSSPTGGNSSDSSDGDVGDSP